jgi:phage shock protein A
MERMETRVQEKEARAAALQELAGDSLEKQFKSFEGKADLEMELLELKNSMGKGGDHKLLTAEKQTTGDPVLLEIKEDEEQEMR